MTDPNPQSSEQNAGSYNHGSHAIDGDYPEVSKPRCGMVLLKYGTSQHFRCNNCNRDKISKKIAFSQKDPTQLICTTAMDLLSRKLKEIEHRIEEIIGR